MLGLGVSAFCIWILSKEVNFSDLSETLIDIKISYVFGAVGLLLLSYLLRAVRWPFFFKDEKVSLKDSYKLVILGFFMNNVLPARMGELVRSHFGGKLIGCSRATVLATVAGERLFDSLAISSLFLIGYFGLGLSDIQTLKEIKPSVSILAGVSAIFFGIGLVTLISLKAEKLVTKIFRLLERIFSKVRFVPLLLNKVEQFYLGLKPMFEFKKLVIISLFSILIWLIETSSFIVICLAFDISASNSTSLLYLGAGAFSSLVPAAPGGVGVIEWAVTHYLKGVGFVAEVALAIAVIQHTAQILVVGIQGILVLIFGNLSNPSNN